MPNSCRLSATVYPLWHQDYDSKAPPTRVGDLGNLTDDGDFAYLFNMFADASDLSSSGRVPPDFIPLTDLPEPAVEQRLDMYKKNAVLTAHSGSNGRDETPYVFSCMYCMVVTSSDKSFIVFVTNLRQDVDTNLHVQLPRPLFLSFPTAGNDTITRFPIFSKNTQLPMLIGGTSISMALASNYRSVMACCIL